MAGGWSKAGLWSAWLLASCAGSARRIEQREEDFGRSVEGRPIVMKLLEPVPSPEAKVTVAGAAETLLAFAGIHGDEASGVTLLDKLVERVRLDPEILGGRRLVVVPALNPDGLFLGMRENARGVDLNRNFPALNWSRRSGRHGESPLSEPEAKALAALIQRYSPRRILSVHAPLHCLNYDGPAAELASAMARACGYPIKASIGYATPGSFGSWAGGDQGIPVVTLELRRGLRDGDLWSELGPALLEFLRWEEPNPATAEAP